MMRPLWIFLLVGGGRLSSVPREEKHMYILIKKENSSKALQKLLMKFQKFKIPSCQPLEF